MVISKVRTLTCLGSRKLNKILFLDRSRCVPGCQLLVLALVQSAAGFDCGSESSGSETRHGPAHTLHRAVLVVSAAHHCPPPERRQ